MEAIYDKSYVYYTFETKTIKHANNLIDINNMDKFMIPPHQKQCIKNIIKTSKTNNNQFSIVNINPKYLYNYEELAQPQLKTVYSL
jgi:hypothetical protein